MNRTTTALDETRGQLLSIIKNVKSESPWKVLVLDEKATSVISAVLRMSEIIEAGVALVENIVLPRCKMPKFEAIYFCAPTVENLNYILRDEDEKLYTASHVYTTSTLSEDCLKVLKGASRIKTLNEVNIDYLAIESNVFVLSKTPDVFGHIYGPDENKSYLAVERTATQLATLCATLNEKPIIRYYQKGSLSVCEDLAKSVKSKVSELVEGEAFVPKRERAQLLIVDRSVDITSALLHEFTYQAMVHDLISLNGDLFEFKVEADKKERKVLLNEQNDPLWTQLRHKHIADTLTQVTEGFQALLAKNKTIKLKTNPEKVTAKDLSEAIKAMPEYREKMEKYQTHIELCQKCLDSYRNITKLTEMEQDLATKEDANGAKIKRIADYVAQLTPIFQSAGISVDNKLRLLLLYVLARGGIKTSDLQLMEKHASIPDMKRSIARNLKQLGVNVIDVGGKDNKSRSRKVREESGEVYKTSRWVPIIKDIMEEAIEHNLSESEFGFVESADKKALMEQSSGGAGAASARSTKPGWANRNRENTSETNVKRGGFWKTEKTVTRGPRVIIFVVGSMTYSEMRCAYEVTEKSKREVMIGSNCALSPNEFLEQIESFNE